MRLFSLFLSIFFLAQPLIAKPSLLKQTDVRKVMTQLFDYHVDKKRITDQLVRRSLKIYIDEFDATKSYMLAGEVKPYIRANAAFVKGIMFDYQKDKFPAYFDLNEKIAHSIARARGWRAKWVQEPASLIQAAKSQQKPQEFTTFATSEKECKNRHKQLFVRLVAAGMQQHPGTLSPEGEKKLIALCERQLTLIENRYLAVDDEGVLLGEENKEHTTVLRILKSLAHSLDAHTAYYSPQEAYAMKVQLERGMCGIGVLLREGIEGVCVADLVAGGPAEKNGLLKVGDAIVEIDGESVRGASFAKVLEVLRGEEGSKTVLGVLREAGSSQETFHRIELVRKKIVLEDKRVDVSAEPYGDGVIGKITLHAFYEGQEGVSSEKDIRKAITELRQQGPLNGLVLDMRGNTGGFLTQAVRVSGLFITSGVVVISKYSDGSIKYYRAVDGSTAFDGPMVVLISRGSASATEIVAQTLQDYGVAVVVGDDRSYGKGTIQHQTVTNDKTNSFFKVTIGRYYTVSGRSTQISGVHTDIVVPTPLGFEEIGESYLDYPLPSDHVSAVFDDPLSDIDPYARKWFAKYYLPTVQKPLTFWKEHLSTLRENSANRLKNSENFQHFLTEVKEKVDVKETLSYGQEDLQMNEAVNIVKDMIYLKQKRTLTTSAAK